MFLDIENAINRFDKFKIIINNSKSKGTQPWSKCLVLGEIALTCNDNNFKSKLA